MAQYGVGGAIFNTGSVIVEDSTFMSNTAEYGGAIGVWQDSMDLPQLTLRRSVFTGNGASGDGGAVVLITNSTLPTFAAVDCDFNGNVAGDNGGGES